MPDAGDLPDRIPLFPLPNVVLFPGMPMPLHIFEPRYRRMVEDVQGGRRTIGMVLLRAGWEKDYAGRPAIYPVGCAGRLEQVEALADGRYNVVLRGLARFRIAEEHAGEPYRVASVEALPDAVGDTASLESARARLLAAIGRASDGPAVLVLQNDLPAPAFVNALCQSLDLEPVERQSLLDCDSVEDRCGRLVEILDWKAMERSHGRAGAIH